MTSRIGLAHVPRKIQEVSGIQVNYRPIYEAAVNGKIPAHFDGSRWSVEEKDIATIVATLGLQPRVANERTARSRVAA